jgi:hypothetical protein
LTDRSFSPSSKVTWVDIPAAEGFISTKGMLFEAPWSSNSSRLVSGCAIDARWANATVWTQSPQAFRAAITEHRRPIFAQESFLPVNSTAWRPISVSNEWLDAINFNLPSEALGLQSPGTTSLEALIDAANVHYNISDLSISIGRPTSLTMIEHVVASVFADALTRVGSYRSFNIDPSLRPEEWSYAFFDDLKVKNYYSHLVGDGKVLNSPPAAVGPFQTFEMQTTITGFGYKASAVTDFLALIVLFAHMFIAICHTGYVLYTKRSSGCWDTITELLALTMQSTPSGALDNTCAGVWSAKKFRETAVIRTSDIDDKHLELKFTADRPGTDNVEIGQLYG